MLIKKAAVIGAGTMGAGIATHLANAGVSCVLLDIVPPDLSPEECKDPKARSRFASGAIARAMNSKPAAFMQETNANLVEIGNVEDDLDRLGECDWIVEAVTEDLDVKRSLYEKIAAARRPGSIVSSNTSGLALNLLVDGFDDDFRRHFLITHFFNPPRYMFLLEVVTGPETLPEVYDTIREFSEVRLGKGVVDCKDTPNFIANRIGVFCMGASCAFQADSGLSIEEIDAITGPVIGRPATATFRLHDLVGIDVAVMVMKNCHRLVPDDESREFFTPPEWLERMVAEGRLGRKSGAGFYRKQGRDILVLDLDAFEYREQKSVRFASLDAAKKQQTLAAKIKTLVSGDDAAATYVWKVISTTLVYSARRVPEISDEIVSVDRAMRWGFNWELGPFELWDALGVRETAERLRGEGVDVPPLVEELLESGHESFYDRVGDGEERREVVFNVANGDRKPVPGRRGVLLLDDVRARSKPLSSNRCATILDIGEGVLCVEFHSKMNSISGETLDMISEACDVAESGSWAGVVIGNQATNFSVGANLVELAGAAKEQKWTAIDALIRNFHRTAMRIRYAGRPIVAAVQGMALGGGCEIPLACDRVQAAAETYIGLVELGVGLIPAGGGIREMACRAGEAAPEGVPVDSFGYVRHFFEIIATGKISTSAAEGFGLGFLSSRDAVSMNRDRTLGDAKRRVLSLAEDGYCAPRERDAVTVAGAPGIAEMRILLSQYRAGGFISEYDEFLATKLAYVLCGGDIDAEFKVTEQHLLDLEREVFLSLLGEEKTLERISHMLKTGKPLRN